MPIKKETCDLAGQAVTDRSSKQRRGEGG